MLEGYKSMASWLEATLGLRYAAATVRRWAKHDGLPVQRARQRVYITEEALRGFVDARRRVRTHTTKGGR